MQRRRSVLRQIKEPRLDTLERIFKAEIQNFALGRCEIPERLPLRNAQAKPQGQPRLADFRRASEDVQTLREQFLYQQRRTAELTLDGARCALCLDDGILLGAARRRPFCEVELELTEGEAGPMLAFAAYLQETYALREERKSKFVRAAELL